MRHVLGNEFYIGDIIGWERRKINGRTHNEKRLPKGQVDRN